MQSLGQNFVLPQFKVVSFVEHAFYDATNS